ncbi:hypothetical protein CPB85DRAFT_403153 [Mucidula mucida]|nr:hypothetical protein CPB85DRAFT_403153 [Mucidula mucida]
MSSRIWRCWDARHRQRLAHRFAITQRHPIRVSHCTFLPLILGHARFLFYSELRSSVIRRLQIFGIEGPSANAPLSTMLLSLQRRSPTALASRSYWSSKWSSDSIWAHVPACIRMKWDQTAAYPLDDAAGLSYQSLWSPGGAMTITFPSLGCGSYMSRGAPSATQLPMSVIVSHIPADDQALLLRDVLAQMLALGHTGARACISLYPTFAKITFYSRFSGVR